MAEVEQTYRFNVKMDCGGCSGAVGRILKKTEGVKSHEISLEKQEVLVKAVIPYDDVLEKIKKTGKQVISGETVVKELDTPAASETVKELDRPTASTLAPIISVIE